MPVIKPSQLLALNHTEIRTESAAMREITENAKHIILTFAVVIAVLGCALAVWISRSISLVVMDVQRVVQVLASASGEVSATAGSLSQASSEQAASVEETSASIEAACARSTAQ